MTSAVKTAQPVPSAAIIESADSPVVSVPELAPTNSLWEPQATVLIVWESAPRSRETLLLVVLPPRERLLDAMAIQRVAHQSNG